jgi:hypothetical protein
MNAQVLINNSLVGLTTRYREFTQTGKLLIMNSENLLLSMHVALNEEVSRLILKHHPATLGIFLQYNVYKPIYDTEVSVLDLIRKSEYTFDIHEHG